MALDGRTARRERNRAAVVEAALSLVDEGILDPTVDQVTERSGVSQRSIFRYFDNLDDLRRAVVGQTFDRAAPLVAPQDVNDPLETRIRRYVDSRVKLGQAIFHVARVARARMIYEPRVADDIRRFRLLLEEQVRAVFAPELRRRRPAEAADLTSLINTMTNVDAYDALLSAYDRSATQIRRAWTRGITVLLSAEA